MSERGAADGRKDIPASNEKALTPIEGLIVNRIEGALRQRSNEILGVGSGQDFTTLPQDLEAMSHEPQTILAQFRAKKARAQNAHGLELTNAQTDFARAYRDYRAFRIQNGLTETEPRYDTVFWRKVFWLALLFTLEVAANGWVIGQASPGGLVQGWTTALMISILVVLTGSLMGAGPWRYLNYRGDSGKGYLHRIWAVPAFLAGTTLLVLFAFYIAHYRYALAHSTLDAPAPDNILSSIQSAPFQPFQQLESLLLFVIALLIGIFAVHRGAHWDDPYPGYGPRHRKVEEARERTEYIAHSLSKEIDEAKDVADQAMKDIAKQSTDAVGALRQAIARTQDNAALWDFTSAELLNAGREAVGLYRDANAEKRSTDEPDYFSSDPFKAITPQSSGQVLETLTNAFSRATQNITACKSQIAGAKAQLEAEYHSFYEDELAPFLKDIANNASVNVRTEFTEVPTESSRPAPAEMSPQGPSGPPEDGGRPNKKQKKDASEDQAVASSPFFSLGGRR